MTEPQTRAGKLLAEHNLRFQEVNAEERNDRVCKTICFKRKDGQLLAALVPYEQRVSYKKLKAYCGMDVGPLSVAELRTIGFEPHECAPMLMPCELIVDPQCLTKNPIQTGSGTLGWGIAWQFADLTTLKEYVILDCAEPK